MQIVLFPNITVVIEAYTIPPIPDPELLDRYHNSRVTTTFVSEESVLLGWDVNIEIVCDMIAGFLGQYGMRREAVYPIVAIAKDPTSKWGAGFPFQVRISIFPAHVKEDHQTRMIERGAKVIAA